MYMILLFLIIVSVVKAPGECPFPSGQFLKMGTNCRSYYQCKEGTAEEKVCPSGERFNQDLGQCDWEEIVTCPDKDNLCVQQDGYFPKQGSKCKSYYACANGIPMQHLCPDERLFNQINGICDWPELVNCRDGFPCPQSEGNFPKQGTKCKSYYQCRNGIPAEIVCPDDMLFSEDNAACDWPELVHCKDGDVALTSIKTTTSTRIPTESSPVPLTTKTSKLPTSSSISTPLLTTPTLKSTTLADTTATTPNSTPIRSTVSIGPSNPTTSAKFTQNSTVISTKATANTQEPNIVTNTAEKSSMITTKFTQIPATKPTEVSTNTTPNLTTLSSSTTKEISSPSTTATITKRTRSPTTIKRTTQKITTAFTSTTQRGCDLEDLDCEPNSLLCPEEFGLVPHPDDHNLFIHCDHWRPYVKKCPANLHFDPISKVCIWPKVKQVITHFTYGFSAA